jgi:hypothetical protein
MSTFSNSTFSKYDHWMTPRHAWEDIKEYIPNKVIWEPFFGDGTSGLHLRDMGFEVIHENIDFFEEDRGEVVVTNPAFSKIPEILKRLKDLNRPFIMIMPSSKINTKYFQKLFTSDIQLIVPPKRINFIKLVDGQVPQDYHSRCNFDCFYYCWNMGLPRDLIFLPQVRQGVEKVAV